jgi:hypothetical protein
MHILWQWSRALRPGVARGGRADLAVTELVTIRNDVSTKLALTLIWLPLHETPEKHRIPYASIVNPASSQFDGCIFSLINSQLDIT